MLKTKASSEVPKDTVCFPSEPATTHVPTSALAGIKFEASGSAAALGAVRRLGGSRAHFRPSPIWPQAGTAHEQLSMERPRSKDGEGCRGKSATEAARPGECVGAGGSPDAGGSAWRGTFALAGVSQAGPRLGTEPLFGGGDRARLFLSCFVGRARSPPRGAHDPAACGGCPAASRRPVEVPGVLSPSLLRGAAGAQASGAGDGGVTARVAGLAPAGCSDPQAPATSRWACRETRRSRARSGRLNSLGT